MFAQAGQKPMAFIVTELLAGGELFDRIVARTRASRARSFSSSARPCVSLSLPRVVVDLSSCL